MIKINIKDSAPISTKISSIIPTAKITTTTSNTDTDVNIKSSTKTIQLETAQSQIEYGHSAYDLAVINGYKGTVQEWLQSIQGKSPYIDPQTNTWWAYDKDTGWYNTEATGDADKPLLKNLTISEEDCLIINCGTSIQVMED